MSRFQFIAGALLAAVAWATLAQDAPASRSPGANPEAAWKYKARRLGRAEVDALLARPETLLVLDVRRPDEQIRYGSFPVFLSIQNSELEKRLAWLPRDREILTVSNHAQRAGAAADLLASRGFKVVGATGSEDYEKAGGQAVAHLRAPGPAASGASAPGS